VTLRPDTARLDDLVEFARVEVDANDCEPWAAIIGWLVREGHLTDEQGLWVTKGYNAYDTFEAGWGLMKRWGTPHGWLMSPDWHDAADWMPTQERRNLRGGKVLQHLEDYAGRVGMDQRSWLSSPLVGDSPQADYRRLSHHVRRIWGVGRQTAFEWVEFLGKANGFPVLAGDGDLWDSSGPRRSLERLFRNDSPSQDWLEAAAGAGKHYLAERGVELSWEDYETIICDFNVMRDGRYYPGRHLAALREELDAAPAEDRPLLDKAWEAVVPPEWQSIAAGIDPEKMPVYRDTGRIRSIP